MIKYFCDRCKEECTLDVNRNRTLLVNDVMVLGLKIVFNGDSTIMLCDRCSHKYYDFIRGEG